MSQQSELLTVSQVSGMLNIHGNTVRRLAEQGLLDSCRIGPRGDQRFRRSDVEYFLRDSLISRYLGALGDGIRKMWQSRDVL